MRDCNCFCPKCHIRCKHPKKHTGLHECFTHGTFKITAFGGVLVNEK